MHLDEEHLHRLMDGELAPAEASAARGHVTDCETCRHALAEAEDAERRTQALLRALDEPAPVSDAETIVALARGDRGPFAPITTSMAPERRERVRSRWRLAPALAAALLLAGAAFAIPGSPVPRWLRAVVERMGAEVAPDVAPRNGAEDGAGIAVVPGASLRVEFTARQTRGVVRVILADGPELVVRAPSGAASYTWGPDRVEIDNRGRSASFEIRVPRSAPRVEIRVEGAPAFLKEGDRVTLVDPREPDVFQISLAH